MKYPTNSYITKDGERRKILSAHDSVRDVSRGDSWHDNWDTCFGGTYTVKELERDNWKEEKVWKLEGGDSYIYLNSGGQKEEAVWIGRSADYNRLAIGNCYDPDDEEAIDRAIERLPGAYKG